MKNVLISQSDTSGLCDPGAYQEGAMIILPEPVKALYAAHTAMCQHFGHTGLTFTLDGKLVGDIGEAVVAEAYGITLCRTRTSGVDGHAADGRSVQIKATGLAKAGPAFTPGEGIADHLIFVRMDFGTGTASSNIGETA